MDIGSGNGYPESALSNFSPHPFLYDGVVCASMEGFLQSLKFENPEMQKYVCTLVGKAAKFKGKPKKWWQTQTLFWKGEPIRRNSEKYQELLKGAFTALCENESFRKAIIASGDAVYTHSMGKNDIHRTVLTSSEFCKLLNYCRDLIRNSTK